MLSTQGTGDFRARIEGPADDGQQIPRCKQRAYQQYDGAVSYTHLDVYKRQDQQIATQIAAMLKDKTPEQQAAVMDIVRTVTIHM